MNVLLVVTLLAQTLSYVHGARIIMTSPQLGSHILEQVSIGEELVSRGHQVYIAIGSRYPKRENIEKRGIKILQYKIPDDVLYGVSSDLERRIAELIFNSDKDKGTASDKIAGLFLSSNAANMAAPGKMASEITNRDCVYMMTDTVFLEKVRALNFELAIIEPFLMAQCNLILPKFLSIPFVSMAILYPPWQIRVPALPSYVPMMSTWTSYSDLTLLARLGNVVKYVFFESILSKIAPQNTSLLERFAPEMTSWNDLMRHSELFLVGTDHHLGSALPQTPSFISVAGITTGKAKKLPEDLEKVLENSSHGAILLSFGSTANYFPKEVIVKFLDAFSKLNQTVLVKFFIPDGVIVPENVKVFSWLPQNDILGHSKTKLFITHCGNNGQHEALYHGVPMIGFPLFGDQYQNCRRGYEKEFGLEMNIHDFTPDELLTKVQEVLNNPKYRSTIVKASETFRDQPMHPRERGAFWIEHVIRHGGKHLRSLAMDMPIYEFLMLDIVGLFVLCFIILVVLFRSLMRCFCRAFTKLHLSRKSNSKLKSS